MEHEEVRAFVNQYCLLRDMQFAAYELEGAALAVGDPVILEVAEDDGLGPGSDGGHECGGLDGTAQNGVRGVGDKTGLPEVLAVVVLQLADGLEWRA